MVHYEGGVEVELRYFLGGVGDKVQKIGGLDVPKPPCFNLAFIIHNQGERYYLHYLFYEILLFVTGKFRGKANRLCLWHFLRR